MDYHKLVAPKYTPQSEALSGQTANNAGGNWWILDRWKMLDRFLILGTEGGTYHVGETKLTKDAAKAVLECIEADPQRVVTRLVEISEAGRAPKNDPAIFVLALVVGHDKPSVRKYGYYAVPRVCRIGTHIFQFAEYVQAFRGWGRGLRGAIASWYNGHKDLPLQVIKYRQRGGWTHRDLLRLCHAKPKDTEVQNIFKWITEKDETKKAQHLRELPPIFSAFTELQRKITEGYAADLIQQYNLPWEAVPNELLASKEVWRALLEHMPYTATIRNLARLTANDTLKPLSKELAAVTDRIRNKEQIGKSRVHPIQILAALCTYSQGHGERGKLTWKPISHVVDALDDAFYDAFGNVKPSGKRMVLALDVSGSMGMSNVSGVPGLTPRVGAAAMALVTAKVEPQYHILAFTAGAGGFTTGKHRAGYRGDDGITPLSISPRMRLDDVVKATSSLPFGGTDCSLPMLWALAEGVAADAFVIYTDNETWAGNTHPREALKEYRRKRNPNAKLIVVGMVANTGSIADPNDAGMLDVAGFDTATPSVIEEFIR